MSKFGIFDANNVPVTTDAYDDAGVAEAVITGAGKQGVWFAKSLEATAAPTLQTVATVSVAPSTDPLEPPVAAAPPIEVVELPVPPALRDLFPYDPELTELPPVLQEQLQLSGSTSAFTTKVALLHGGGVGSTAMLLHLLQQGCEVHPYFVRIFKHKALNDQGQAMAERAVRRLRDWNNNVARLEVLDTDKRQRTAPDSEELMAKLLDVLTTEAGGEGFNVVAFGGYRTDLGDEASLDYLAQTQLVQLYSWADVGAASMTELLSQVDDNLGPFRQLLADSTTSCLKPDEETGLDCGECDACRARVAAFTEAYGEDRSRYSKKSTARKRARRARLEEGNDVALSPTALGGRSLETNGFPLLVTKVRHDGRYEVGLFRGGKLAAQGTFSRSALVRK